MVSVDIDDNLMSKLKEEPKLRHVSGPFELILRQCYDANVGLDTLNADADLNKGCLKWALQILILSQLEVPRHVCWEEDSQYSIHVLCESSI